MFWKQFYRNIIFSICLAYPFQVQSHGNGAPANRCDSMLPGHWVTPQETISPFQISIDKTKITPGDRVNITLSTIPGHPTGFKGFFVMVKDLDNNGTNYGIFDLNSSDLNHARPVHCFEVRNSAMTHSANDAKKSVELTWIAPEIEHSENGSDVKGKQLKVV
ncbi:unnamed protein product [Orchesella dallaii]|uniref:Reelin domain-containing protein n=1 Tax=Orchesella dallaii TaxID=48710 RepID=A0ABP1RRD4_9HEXA